MAASRDDVRRELVLEPRDLVAQQELALLQPLQLQLVGLAGVSQGLDRRVEIAGLFAQPLDLATSAACSSGVSSSSSILRQSTQRTRRSTCLRRPLADMPPSSCPRKCPFPYSGVVFLAQKLTYQIIYQDKKESSGPNYYLKCGA